MQNDFEKELVDLYGPILGGKDLIRALGYRTGAAFRKAARENILGINIFEIPGRQGKFAMTRDVSTFLVKCSLSQETSSK